MGYSQKGLQGVRHDLGRLVHSHSCNTDEKWEWKLGSPHHQRKKGLQPSTDAELCSLACSLWVSGDALAALPLSFKLYGPKNLEHAFASLPLLKKE